MGTSTAKLQHSKQQHGAPVHTHTSARAIASANIGCFANRTPAKFIGCQSVMWRWRFGSSCRSSIHRCCISNRAPAWSNVISAERRRKLFEVGIALAQRAYRLQCDATLFRFRSSFISERSSCDWTLVRTPLVP